MLNEPESSLHPELLAPLAHLFGAPALVDALAAEDDCLHHRLAKELGATVLPEQMALEKARWRWPD